jgi:tetratricopeptide (TPR) repeat protein
MKAEAAQSKRRSMRWCWLLPIVFLVLAGCATVSNPSASDQDKRLYPGSQSNVASLSEVIAAHPDDPQAYNMRGGEAGRSEPALTDFNKAISLDPNYAQAYANRALVYRKINKLDLTLADDNKALAIDPSYASAYLGRGIVYREQGRNNQALEDFNKAITLRPENPEAFYNRGLLYQTQRQHTFAIDDFSTAIGFAGQKTEPYVARAQLSGA